MKHGITIAVLILLFVVGCAQESVKVKVTYLSDPAYASVYSQDGSLQGTCPLELWYPVDAEAKEQGYLYAKGMTIRWISGAERSSGKTIKIIVDGTNRQVTFVRPKYAPNVFLDVEHALQKEREANRR